MAPRLQATWMHDDHPSGATTIAALAPPDPRIAAAAGGLARSGLGRGDVVAWQLPNGEPSATLLWACWQLGVVAVPLHHLASDREVAAMLGALPVDRVLDADDADRLVHSEPIPDDRPLDGGPAPDDLALVLHTSGSSGAPKAVLHTQATLGYKAVQMVRVHGLGPSDVVLMPAPLGHISGVLNGVTVPAAAGMRSILMARWDPEAALALIESERVTFMVGPPTFFIGLRDAAGFRPERVRSLRLISMGGAGVSPDICAEIAGRFGAVVKRSYGSTEAPTVTTSWAGDPDDRRFGTDGRSTSGSDAPAPLRLAPDGELLVRGPELFVGYADPARNAGAITDDGWFRSGDVATIDEGWLTITGRVHDMIVRGGENISPSEVEAALGAHSAVRDAVVVGVADPRLGERVGALVVTSPGAPFDLDECRRWCEEQGLTRFKWPEVVRSVPELPVLASGKADRASARELLLATG